MTVDVSFADQIVCLPPRDVEPPPDGLRYIIATSQRTGSTLLTDALTGTGVAGAPDEWFLSGGNGNEALKLRFGIRGEADYIDRIIQATATANGVFGTKLFWRQWDVLIPRLIAKTGMRCGQPIHDSLPDLLTAGLGRPIRYIWLRRRNKLAQAISLYRARNTGEWRAIAGRGDGASAADRDLAFDYDKITAIKQNLEDEDRKWNSYFHQYRLTALMLVYEDFIANYEQTVRGVLKFLDLPYQDVTVIAPRLVRQADNRSREWESMWRDMDETGRKGLRDSHA